MRRAGPARGAPAAALIVALGMALGLVAGAAGAVNKWIAVGDSIMAGSTWPCESPSQNPFCPEVFDCSGGCNLTPPTARDQCGIVRRLDVFLGGTDYVQNLGVSGETTAGGLSRLQMTVLPSDCPGAPGECIAMILMHGTNDMCCTGVSPESATFNLQAMIQAAKGHNIDTLLMTIIRKYDEPSNSRWSAYHDLTVALAATENIPLVDPYIPLCPDATCYNANYWVASSCGGVPGETSVGHPDPDGYNIMGNLVTAAFPVSVPDTPSTTSPVGTVCTMTPQFVWPEVPAARWYALEVDATTTTWWEAAAHCSGGTCSATPGALAAGPHSWQVQGRNLRGLSLWSAAANFVVGDTSQQDLEDLEPGPVTATKNVYHCGPVTAAATVPYAIESTGNLTVETPDSFAAFSGFTVAGALTVKVP